MIIGSKYNSNQKTNRKGDWIIVTGSIVILSLILLLIPASFDKSPLPEPKPAIVKKVQPTISYDTSVAFQTLHLSFDEDAKEKLEKTRTEAEKNAVYMVSEDDWVNARYHSQGGLVPIRLRYKGDWMDHLRRHKPSFRIKVRAPDTWNRLKVFSVHTPKSRGFLREWFYHQFLFREGLLATRYDFIKVVVNEDSLGVYAYEEHFDLSLPEYNQRREGPIIKFDEEAVWYARIQSFLHGQPNLSLSEAWLNSYGSSEPVPFQETKINNSPTLQKQYETAQGLLVAFQFGLKPAEEVFDIEKTARHLAIMDITKAYHNIIWHNLRFYFNPVIERLEPIAFDGFTNLGAMDRFPTPFMGYGIDQKVGYFSGDYMNSLFLDETFMASYLKALYEFSDSTYINTLLEALEPGLIDREKFLKEEFADSQFDREEIKRRARNIFTVLLPINQVAVKARIQERNNREIKLAVSNAHVVPLKIVGTGRSTNFVSFPLDTAITLNAYNPSRPLHYTHLSVNPESAYVFYRLPGFDSLYFSKMLDLKVADWEIASTKIGSTLMPVEDPIFTAVDDRIIFPKGKFQVKESIVIPKGYKVTFDAGCQIDFIQGAGFICKSPVQMFGTEEEPIRILSSDNTATGFTVLQASSKSFCDYVIFEGLNTLAIDNWQLTGAVTFYESDIKMHHCYFLDAKCEDALNIIRSDVNMDYCRIVDASYDGLDLDFCAGYLEHCLFENSGNDGLDLSGSKLRLGSIEITGAGDKGLSVGEQSTITFTSGTIAGAKVAVAVKDLSGLHIVDINLIRCDNGFAAYQKKPEFGGGSITVDNYTAKGVGRLYIIETGSELVLGDITIKGEI